MTFPRMRDPRLAGPAAVVAAPVLAYALLRAGLEIAAPALLFALAAGVAMRAPRLLMVLVVPAAMVAVCVPVPGLPPGTTIAALCLLLAVVAAVRAPDARIAPLVLLGALLTVSFAVPAGGHPAAARDLLLPLAGLALAAAAALLPPRPRLLLAALVAGGCGVAALALLRGGVGARLMVGELNPNYLGAVLVPAVIAAAALARRNPLWLAALAPCGAALLATESRGAVLGAVTGLGYLLLSGRRSRMLLAAGTVAAAVLLGDDLLSLDLLNLGAGDRDAVGLAHNADLRTTLLRVAVDSAVDHPLRGLGLGGFAPHVAVLPEIAYPLVPHNDYLRLAAESGVPSLVVFGFLLWRALRVRGHSGLRAVLAGLATHMMFIDTLHQLAVSCAFWSVLGTLLAANQHHLPAPRRP